MLWINAQSLLHIVPARPPAVGRGAEIKLQDYSATLNQRHLGAAEGQSSLWGTGLQSTSLRQSLIRLGKEQSGHIRSNTRFAQLLLQDNNNQKKKKSQ